jgi:hypothetical protein
MRIVAPAVLAAVCLLAAAPAGALTLLTTGKVGVFSSRPGRTAEAVVRVGRDRALAAIPSPACPTEASFRLAYSRTGGDFEDHGEIPLPCDRWQRRGRSWRFSGAHGAPGGVRSIVLDARRLVVRAGGPEFEAVRGPLAWVEAWLTVGGERYLVRLQNFRRNDARRVVSRRPSASAAAGEAAFWDTLWADAPRADEALQLLERATRRQRSDGRSQFLLGMLHLYRSSLACPTFDFTDMCDAGRDEGAAAGAALDRAVDLLPHDSRIPGFRAASTYANGYVLGDPALLALGTQQIADAVAANPLFNAFDLFAVVAPVTDGASPYYQNEILPLADFVFSNAACLDALPEICGNAGMAPHNFEGTLLLLGDIYAKGGRLADAQFWYNFAVATGQGSGYRFQAVAADRAATAAARVALSQDADPSNDPPLLGGGGGSCVYCHNK